MIVLRCTQRLAKRCKLQLDSDVSPSSGTLGDWYANVLNVGHHRLVLCLSERSLLPVILPARRQEFPGRFPSYLESLLIALEIVPAAIAGEIDASQKIQFARTANKALLGSLNDFAYHAQVNLSRGESLFEASLHLGEMPSKPIDFDSPDRVTRALFASGRA